MSNLNIISKSILKIHSSIDQKNEDSLVYSSKRSKISSTSSNHIKKQNIFAFSTNYSFDNRYRITMTIIFQLTKRRSNRSQNLSSKFRVHNVSKINQLLTIFRYSSIDNVSNSYQFSIFRSSLTHRR